MDSGPNTRSYLMVGMSHHFPSDPHLSHHQAIELVLPLFPFHSMRFSLFALISQSRLILRSIYIFAGNTRYPRVYPTYCTFHTPVSKGDGPVPECEERQPHLSKWQFLAFPLYYAHYEDSPTYRRDNTSENPGSRMTTQFCLYVPCE